MRTVMLHPILKIADSSHRRPGALASTPRSASVDPGAARRQTPRREPRPHAGDEPRRAGRAARGLLVGIFCFVCSRGAVAFKVCVARRARHQETPPINKPGFPRRVERRGARVQNLHEEGLEFFMGWLVGWGEKKEGDRLQQIKNSRGIFAKML